MDGLTWLMVTIFCCGLSTSTGGKSALLIIDVQECFLPHGSMAVKNGQDIIPVINGIRADYEDVFSLVVLTQDWHCPNHVSFASQHLGYKPYDKVKLDYDNNGNLCDRNHACSKVSYNITQVLWPDHCIANISSGRTSSKISPKLTRKTTDVIIKKGDNCQVDSYSAFYDNGDFRQTRLNRMLQDDEVDTVYVTGLALDYCVYYSSLDARKLGYKTYLVKDASRGIASETVIAALKDLKKNGVHVINSSALGGILTNSGHRYGYRAILLPLVALFFHFL